MLNRKKSEISTTSSPLDVGCISMLDSTLKSLQTGNVTNAINSLFAWLREKRANTNAEQWKSLIESELLKHPIQQLLHDDPFTHRAFIKPRGYPGDAVLIDYIYGSGDSSYRDKLTPIARDIHDYTTNAPASRAVRFRRNLLAKTIDAIAYKTRSANVLSVACGHLREVELSTIVRANGIGRFVALDQDKMSLDVVEKEYGKFGVEPVQGTIKGIISGQIAYDGMHLIYAAGLYDYLPQPAAQKLTRNLFNMLAPGGMLLVANFLPDIHDVGYMESYMGWHLVFRTEAELVDVFSRINHVKIASLTSSYDPDRNIVFATAYRSSLY